jgi:hypothetical protein
MARALGRFLACAGFLVIALTTLVPIPQQTAASALTPWWCLVCGEYGGVDVVNNILLFLPAGLGLSLGGLRIGKIILVGGLVSLGIELLQATVIVGRDASLSDVVTNTLGSGLGAWIGTGYRRLMRPGPAEALRFAAVGAVAWLASLILTGLLLRPWAPQNAITGMWLRSAASRPAYDGRVLSAVLSGTGVPVDSESVGSEVLSKIREGNFDLGVVMLTGNRRPKWAPVVEIFGSGEPLLSLETLGEDLAFEPPLVASQLRLRRPALRLVGALKGGPGSRVDVVTGESWPTVWAEWTVRGSRSHTSALLSPGLGWTLFTPLPYALGPEARLITLVWMAGWLLPLGYWTAFAPGRPFLRRAGLVLLTLVGLGLIPRMLGYPPGHWSEWLAALLGLSAGAAGHSAAAYFGKRCDSPFTNEFC